VYVSYCRQGQLERGEVRMCSSAKRRKVDTFSLFRSSILFDSSPQSFVSVYTTPPYVEPYNFWRPFQAEVPKLRGGAFPSFPLSPSPVKRVQQDNDRRQEDSLCCTSSRGSATLLFNCRFYLARPFQSTTRKSPISLFLDSG